MSDIYLKDNIEKSFPKLRFSKFKKFVSRSVFGELQLTQISLNYKTPCCNLKIGSGNQTVCGVSINLFLKGIMMFSNQRVPVFC